jgi:predicted MFS family arabinose efflux permease
VPTDRGLRRLVAATAVTNAGSMLTAIALPLAAIGALGAGASQLAALRIAGLLPGLVLGPWLARAVDRASPRRALVAAELLGALAVAAVAVSHALGVLSLAVLMGSALALGAASFAFGVARVAAVPALVERAQFGEANAALRTAEAASEGVAFAAGGALVQAVGAPTAIGLDALSFLGSAALLRGLPGDEPAPARERSREPGALAAGLRRVGADPVLAALAVAYALIGLGTAITGVVYLLFATRTLGFEPGLLGVVFALGSLSSVAGGVLAPRALARLGVGAALILGVAVFGLCGLALPLASGAGASALALLALHQLGDGFYVTYDVAQTGTQQRRVAREELGRVNGVFRSGAALATLLGAALGGVLGEALGPRAALVAGAGSVLAAAAILALSPVRRSGGEPPLT